jgi:hypothetical protein
MLAMVWLNSGPYGSGPSKLWLKTKNVTKSELILLGTDRDNTATIKASRLPISGKGRGVNGLA